MKPEQPVKKDQESIDYWDKRWKPYRQAVSEWELGEVEPKNIVLEQLSKNIWPQNYQKMTAAELYDSVSCT